VREIPLIELTGEKAIASFMDSQGCEGKSNYTNSYTNSQSALSLHGTCRFHINYVLLASCRSMKDGEAVPGGTIIDSLDAQFAASQYPKS